MIAQQLSDLIITPTLTGINLYSKESADLIIGTCKQESNLGYFIKQVKGPAVGIYQCEPETFRDLWTNYLITTAKRRQLLNLTLTISQLPPIMEDYLPHFHEEELLPMLMGNLIFATAICRIHYLRISELIPKYEGDRTEYIASLAAYYKKYYNTYKGAATMDQIIKNFDLVIMQTQ